MSYFIKAGYWEQLKKGYKGWLDLTNLIEKSTVGKENVTNNAVTLTDGATINIASQVNKLTSAAATRTFTISSVADVTETEVTLNAVSAVYTYPVGSLCINSDGTASGDNTLTLSGVSGDKYVIMTSKIGSNYYVIAKNFGQ